MGKHQVIEVELSQPMVRIIDEAVATGDYASNSEVVQAALSAWLSSRLPLARDEAHLMRMLQEGIDSGPSTPADEVFAELEARYADDRDG